MGASFGFRAAMSNLPPASGPAKSFVRPNWGFHFSKIILYTDSLSWFW